MAGKSSRSGNWSPNSPATRYKASGKNREFYTFENAPGLGNYATGGTIIDGGDGYIYHIFTGDGTFTVNRPSAAIDSVDYLIVAGGGAGGGGSPGTSSGGGGGGGGFLFGSTPVGTSSYPITVGGGGAANPQPNPAISRNGTPSTAFGLTAAGGGGGGSYAPGSTINNGAAGGSGGGGCLFPPSTGISGGNGGTPATIPRQGYNGSVSVPSAIPASTRFSGGGGGAGGAGGFTANGLPSGPPYSGYGQAGPGRISPEFPIDIISRAIPSATYPSWYPNVSPTGLAKGGNALISPNTGGVSGPNNSGFGGEGPGATVGNNGGSGIVCIRYKKTAAYSRATGGTIEPSTHPEHPGVWRHIFTSPGDFTVTDPTLQYIDYLAVGGGGGGGNTNPAVAGGGGGGGAGGFVSSIHTSTTTPLTIPEAYPWSPGYSVEVGEQYPVGIGTYPIGIGTGGNASTSGNNTTIGSPGSNQIIAYGGGGGAQMPGAGTAGGSSGGNASTVTQPRAAVAASPSPNIQGNASGASLSSSVIRNSSGGGGAGASGAAGVAPSVAPYPGVEGGAGWYSVLSPSAYGTPGPLTPTAQYRYFAGGGGSGGGFRTDQPTSAAPGGAGGAGGGGAGGTPPSSPGTSAGTPGTTNTGGGGGGAGSAAGTGGPGIVIIQYPE
jgi:hypothetical protein